MSRALPLLSHCLVHLVLALALILLIAPRFWFIAFIEFAILYRRGSCQGYLCLGLQRDTSAPVVWTLIGVDQTLHSLTGFGLAIVMAFNA